MSKKNTKANKIRWGKYSSEERKEKMSIIAHKRWDNMTLEQKKEHGKKMSLLRKKARLSHI